MNKSSLKVEVFCTYCGTGMEVEPAKLLAASRFKTKKDIKEHMKKMNIAKKKG